MLYIKMLPTPAYEAGHTSTGDHFPAELPFRQFDPTSDIPKNAFMNIYGARRQGKTQQVIEMMRAFHTQKRFTHYILVSQTLSGYDELIPPNYQYRSLEHIPTIIERSIDVAEFNSKQEKPEDMVRCAVCLVLDDVVGDASELRKSGGILQKLAVQGRHIHKDDKHPENEFTTILISQRASGLIPPVIRNNSDIVMWSATSNKRDRITAVEESLSLKSDRQGMKDALEVFDTVTLSKPYRFLVVATHIASRRAHTDYVFYSDSNPDGAHPKLFGTEDDWRSRKKRIHF